MVNAAQKEILILILEVANDTDCNALHWSTEIEILCTDGNVKILIKSTISILEETKSAEMRFAEDAVNSIFWSFPRKFDS